MAHPWPSSRLPAGTSLSPGPGGLRRPGARRPEVADQPSSAGPRRDPGRGWQRRVIPSPLPQRPSAQFAWRGGVIEKDLASSMLARDLDVGLVLISTGVRGRDRLRPGRSALVRSHDPRLRRAMPDGGMTRNPPGTARVPLVEFHKPKIALSCSRVLRCHSGPRHRPATREVLLHRGHAAPPNAARFCSVDRPGPGRYPPYRLTTPE